VANVSAVGCGCGSSSICGDGYYLMSRRCYDQLQKAKWEPFGAFLLTPDKMVERYDRITQGGGYFA